MEELHQQKVSQMIESAEGSAGLLHKLTKQILKKEEEDARLLDRCEAKRKEWAKHWQCGESVPDLEDKPWKNEELKKLEEALSVESVRGKDRSGMRWLPPKSSLGFDKRNKKINRGVLGQGGAEWEMAAASLHDDVLLDTEECHE